MKIGAWSLGKPKNKSVRARPMPAWAGGERRKRSRLSFGSVLGVLLVLGVAAAAVWLLSPEGPLPARQLSGTARVVDGDTLRIGDDRIRIQGIDAPEMAQTCTKAGAAWECGTAARAQLVEIIGGRQVNCRPEARDRYGRIVATCRVGGADIGGRMVSAGLAIADDAYGAEQLAARIGRRGIWAGKFDRPADWRRANTGEESAEGWPSRIAVLFEWVSNMLSR